MNNILPQLTVKRYDAPLYPVHTSNNVESTLSNSIQSRMLLRQSRTLFRHCCQKRCNNVEATFEMVACCFDKVASTLLLVWTGLYTVTLFPHSVISSTQRRRANDRKVTDGEEQLNFG